MQNDPQGDAPATPAQAQRLAARITQLNEGFSIARALPHPQRHTIGAWCFMDHLGPADFEAGQGLHVGPHPHIGLQTFTWMMEGEITHRDSLGFEQVIRPGQVNLMTAGHGISHAEDATSEAGGRVHAVQLWIALPEAVRDMAPAFVHHAELPLLKFNGLDITLLVGEALGARSPVQVHTPLLALDLIAVHAVNTALPLQTAHEHGVLVLQGQADIDGEPLTPGTLHYLPAGRDRLMLRTNEAARLMVIGGQPFDEKPLLWWNFVGRSQQDIEAATHDWTQGTRFGEVHGSPSARLKAPSTLGIRLKGG